MLFSQVIVPWIRSSGTYWETCRQLCQVNLGWTSGMEFCKGSCTFRHSWCFPEICQSKIMKKRSGILLTIFWYACTLLLVFLEFFLGSCTAWVELYIALACTFFLFFKCIPIFVARLWSMSRIVRSPQLRQGQYMLLLSLSFSIPFPSGFTWVKIDVLQKVYAELIYGADCKLSIPQQLI